MDQGCHWKYRLFCVDDKSFLDFVDYKGKAAVQFVGTLAAHRSAMRLLNYLAGEKFIHPL
jgi:hypothetical protein